jgi:geranylgeranyl diphosphate synthase, type II
MTMDLRAYLEEKRRIVEAALRRFAPLEEGPAEEVMKAMNYSLFAGGKRLRPILCLAGATAVGGNESLVLPVATALEMIHTYSLIHDDLPAMDNDDLRRGRPTSHKVFGEAVALLAGDGLLTEAFALMARRDVPGNPEPGSLLRVIALIARAAGHDGMVGGQVVDIRSEGKALDPATVEFIHTHKTGALITASVVSGAVLAGGDERQVEAITAYGKAIGLAFQIADDILDIEGDAKQMGKSVGGDARKKKITYPSVLGLEASRKIQTEMVENALNALRDFDEASDPLRHLAGYIIERKK